MHTPLSVLVYDYFEMVSQFCFSSKLDSTHFDSFLRFFNLAKRLGLRQDVFCDHDLECNAEIAVAEVSDRAVVGMRKKDQS